MNGITEAVLTIVTAIIGVAVLALLISPKSKTSEVIQAGASGVVNMLATAQSPVTGEKVNIVSAYPNANPFGMGNYNNY